MKILGDEIFAKNADGKLKSRVGTVFLKTPGLVTVNGIHAMQRMAWIDELNRERAEKGEQPLSANAVADELDNSVDLVFTDDAVLIRPDPERMDLAFQADEALQKLVSKRKIRFMNTHTAKVRNALRSAGDNWRMARQPESPEEIVAAIERASTAIGFAKSYYYAPYTGTRFLTAGGLDEAMKLQGDEFVGQVSEIVKGLKGRNRLGQPEIGLFPTTLPPDVKSDFLDLDLASGADALRAKVDAIALKWRMALPAQLREESTDNLEWRNEMSALLARQPNETSAGDEELVKGISPEFYRQIEWLPGGKVRDGRLEFDPLFEEAQRTGDPDLLAMCDMRVRSIVFNALRLFSSVEYVNIGRISRSLARNPVEGHRRGQVYFVQFKERCQPDERLFVIRFQKWGVAEHLDEGKDMLTAMYEANQYMDYILDRRLACLQLGMNLPYHVGAGRLTEKYLGENQYHGASVQAFYYARQYIRGTASAKIPPARFANPAFARRFAQLMGEAAAVDMAVGRRATETGEHMFDKYFEMVQLGPDGLPERIVVTDHAGSFVNYKHEFVEYVPAYANVMRRRKTFVQDYDAFCDAYVSAFRAKLEEMQRQYLDHPRAFDELFADRPYDQAGSGAYRWSCVLKRIAACDPAKVAGILAEACRI